MATAEAESSQDERVPPGGAVDDGFISYSHAADDLLAPRLQAGLQRFAKDRPANATQENGVAWVDLGHRGEGIDDDLNREDYAFIVFRFMHNNHDWAHDPSKIVEQFSEEKIMGPYFPRMSYTDKATFETEGA